MNRTVGAGGAGAGAMVPPDFARLVNTISTRGLDYAHHITSSPSREAKMNIGVHLSSSVTKDFQALLLTTYVFSRKTNPNLFNRFEFDFDFASK